MNCSLISVFLLLFQVGFVSTGTSNLNISVINTPPQFTVGTYGGTILPGTSESTTLTYLGQGTPEIPLSIDSNASPSPYYINLTAEIGTPPVLSAFTLVPPNVSLAGGTTGTADVTINQSAPASGTIVALSSSNTNLIPIQPTVTIPSNSTSATVSVPVTTQLPLSSVDLMATLNGSQKVLTVNVEPTGSLPSVSLTAPTSGASFSQPANVSLAANATPHGSASISNISYFEMPSAGGQLVQIDEQTFAQLGAVSSVGTWSNAPSGQFLIYAEATDSNNLVGSSGQIPISVNAPPTVDTPVISPASGNVTAPYTVTITDQTTSATIFYTADGTMPSSTSTMYTGQLQEFFPTTFSAIAYAPGYVPSVVATANYTVNYTSRPGTPPTLAIANPGDGTTVTSITNVTGTVTQGRNTIVGWTLRISPITASGNPVWKVLGTGANTGNGIALGTLDPTMMLNGEYDLELETVDSAGQTTYIDNTIVIEGNQKLGYFTFSYNDLTIPAAGIPITLTRTYDSRDKSVGDFGVGWVLSATDVSVQKNGAIGAGWSWQNTNDFIDDIEVTANYAHVITITMPGGAVYSFEANLSPWYAPGGVEFSTFGYTAIGTTKGTLTDLAGVSDGDVAIVGNENGSADIEDLNLGGTYDCNQFQLVTPDGTKFDVDTTNGLMAIIDRNGNTLTFNGSGGTVSGITSAPASPAEATQTVQFTRDGLARSYSLMPYISWFV